MWVLTFLPLIMAQIAASQPISTAPAGSGRWARLLQLTGSEYAAERQRLLSEPNTAALLDGYRKTTALSPIDDLCLQSIEAEARLPGRAAAAWEKACEAALVPQGPRMRNPEGFVERPRPGLGAKALVETLGADAAAFAAERLVKKACINEPLWRQQALVMTLQSFGRMSQPAGRGQSQSYSPVRDERVVSALLSLVRDYPNEEIAAQAAGAAHRFASPSLLDECRRMRDRAALPSRKSLFDQLLISLAAQDREYRRADATEGIASQPASQPGR